jgi:hypothetical protein
MERVDGHDIRISDKYAAACDPEGSFFSPKML